MIAYGVEPRFSCDFAVKLVPPGADLAALYKHQVCKDSYWSCAYIQVYTTVWCLLEQRLDTLWLLGSVAILHDKMFEMMVILAQVYMTCCFMHMSMSTPLGVVPPGAEVG